MWSRNLKRLTVGHSGLGLIECVHKLRAAQEKKLRLISDSYKRSKKSSAGVIIVQTNMFVKIFC